MITYRVGETILLDHKKEPVTKAAVQPFVKRVETYGTPKKNPNVTVQIAAYNEGQDLIKCLNSVTAQDYDNYEIVLVDNGLDAQTKESLKQYDLVYIEADDNVGCSHGRNLGAAYASGELIAFIDADGYIKTSYLQKAVKALKDKALVAVRGRVLPYENSSQVPGHYDLGDEPVPSLISTEGNSVWRTADYKQVGGFENSLAGAEGLVLCYRMHVIHGYKREAFRYDPSLVLYHDFHSNKQHLEKKMYRQALIRDAIMKRYPLIGVFEEWYRQQGARPRQVADAAIADAAERAKARVHNQYLDLYNEMRRNRFNDPSLIKSQASYDFSVIVPCYNLGQLINKAVESVMAQSVDLVQIIVVDDASDDTETVGVLKELEAHVEVVYLKENAGVANARNKGIERAKSDYILCLDADDTIEPAYLEKAKNVFELYPKAGIVSTWAKYFGAVDSEWHVKGDISLADALVASPVPTASCFRKKAWQQAGGYETKMRGYEDWELWISILEHDWHVEVIPELNFNYFVRPDGKVKTSNKNVAELVGRIYDNHQASYEKHSKEVLTEKHRQIIQLRAQNQALRDHSVKVALLNSPFGPPLRAMKQTAGKLYNLAKDCRESGSLGASWLLIAHFIQVTFYRLRRKLKPF